MTWMVTAVWKSAAVVKVCLAFVGMVVFFSTTWVIIPPSVSTPSESGVTSRRRISLTSPARTPPCIAAPTATASIGSTPLSAGLPITSSTVFRTSGMRVMPPMRITFSMSLTSSFASWTTFLIGVSILVTMGLASSSSFALVSV